MTITEFNKKYKLKGGIKQLFDMREDLATLKEISEHFGISRERIRQLMVDLFKENYDPRYERREKTIRAIKNLIVNYGVEKVQVLYLKMNRDYLQAAVDAFHLQENNSNYTEKSKELLNKLF